MIDTAGSLFPSEGKQVNKYYHNSPTLLIVHNEHAMRSLLTFFSIALFQFTQAQVAPGGVGNDNQNRFWLKVEDLNQNNNTSITNWDNFGGSNNDAYQNSNNAKPLLKDNALDNMNGYPVIEFDGSNDHFRINNTTDLNVGHGPWNERSFYIVFRTSNDIGSRQVIYEEGGNVRGFNIYIYNNNLYFGAWNLPNQGPGSSWGFNETHSAINTNTEYLVSMRFIGTDSNAGVISCSINGFALPDIQNVGWIYNHSGAISIGSKRGDTYYENGASSGNGHYFNGQLTEFIMYDHYMSASGHQLISNYLSSKYEITLSNNDVFQLDDPVYGDYDHDLAGIYRISSTDLYADGQGSGKVRIHQANNLDDNEFLIWANDGGNFEGGDLIDIPAGIQGRLQRNWRVQEQGEVGDVTVAFDLSNVGSVTASDLRLLVDTDNDGTFTDETIVSGGVIDGAVAEGNGIYSFSTVGSLNNETKFSLGSINLMQTPLPIELLEFTGKQQDMEIHLDWSTLSETDNSHFDIEKMDDAKNWKAIGKIEAIGNSTSIQTYDFIDAYPKPGSNIYRLVQYDNDGHGEYIKTISVNFQLEELYTVYPNPVKDMLIVNIDQKQNASIRLINVEGEEIQVPETISDTHISLDISFLNSGMYVLQINENGTIKSKKIIIP